MRVTTNLMVTNTLRRLSSRLEQYESKQEQLATGRRINRTSDDPAGASRSLVLNSAIRARTQERRNADDAVQMLDTADSKLQGAVTAMHRVKDLTVRASNDLGPVEREAIARELEQLQGTLVGIANSTSGDKPLFSGTHDGLAVENVAGSWTYTGDNGNVMRRISEQDRVTANVTADEIFGFGSPQGDVFTIIDDLIGALDSDDTATLNAGLGRLNDAFSSVTEQLSVVGAVTNRVESARDRTQNALMTLRRELAEVQDVDLEEAIMDLQVEEIAYEATLQALGRSLPQSLIAFMR
ncbi:MAG: flagellar hook-associated protein 3 FlgL [Nitriliruptoraceae bacterium]|jgi:flagellar hook-associated protein 3 FlgL